MFGHHQQNQVNHQLPFNPDQVDQSTFEYNLPNQVYVPNISLSVPEMQEYLPMITGFTRKELQDNTELSAARRFLYNRMSQNHFQNPEFADLLNAVGQYAGAMAFSSQNPNMQQLVHQAAKELCAIMASLQVKEFPDLASRLSPQALQAGEGWLQHYGKIDHMIGQFMHALNTQPQQGYQQYGGGGYGQPQNRNSQWASTPQNFGGGQPQQYQGGPLASSYGGRIGSRPANQGSYAHLHQAAMTRGTPQYGSQPNDGRGQRNLASSPMSRAHREKSEKPVRNPKPEAMPSDFGGNVEAAIDPEYGYVDFKGDSGPWDEPTQPTTQERYRNTMRGGPVKSQGTPAPERQRKLRHESVEATPPPVRESRQAEQPAQASGTTQVMDPNRPYDHFFIDGIEYRPAFKSGWKRTFHWEQPYSIAWDSDKEILFHLRFPDGRIFELPLPLDESMTYLKHELDTNLRRAKTEAERRQENAVRANWRSLVEEPKVVDKQGEFKKSVDVKAPKAPLALPDILQAHSYDESKLLCAASLTERGVSQAYGVPIEHYYREVKPFVLPDNIDVEAVRTTITDLYHADNFDDAVEMLRQAADVVPVPLWRYMEECLTNRVNAALQRNMQMEGWYLDSVVEDWVDLDQGFVEKFGPEEGKSISETLTQVGLKDLLEDAFGHLTGEAFDEYVAQLPKHMQTPELINRLVIMEHPTSVTSLPWHLVRNFQFNGEGSAVYESKFPEIYQVLKGIFARTDRIGLHFTHHYLETFNGERFEITRGYFGKDHYLIRHL